MYPVFGGRGLRSIRSKTPLVSLLRVLWLAFVLWYELGTFCYSLARCGWPDNTFRHIAKPTHILVITDPQVKYLPQALRNWSNSLQLFFYHLSLRKSWKYASKMRPNAVVFLGDMLAGGHHTMSDEEYVDYHNTFDGLFPLPISTSVFYIPGNEDVGLNIEPAHSRQARRRYTNYFGPSNYQSSVSGHNLVFLDAPALVEEDYLRVESGESWSPVRGGAHEFVKSIAQVHNSTADLKGQPTLLFSHIPLSRPESASCGPLRERGNIRRRVGPGFQSILGKKTSTFLLQSIRPSLIFSGDDRDYCEHVHHVPSQELSTDHAEIREVTVKSFSRAKEISRPGFHLLSLVSPASPSASASLPTFADKSCFFPDPLSQYSSRYFPLTILTFLVLFVTKYRNANPPKLTSLPSHCTPLPSPVKEPWPHLSTGGGWSPSSPLLPKSGRISPRHPLPSTLRTPGLPNEKATLAVDSDANENGTPTFRASTHTGSLLLPAFLSANDTNERFPPSPLDGSHQPRAAPSVWMTTANSADMNGNSPHDYDFYVHHECGPDYEDKAYSPDVPPSFFTPPLSGVHRSYSVGGRGGWSWAFVFRSRRRRITLRWPKFGAGLSAAGVEAGWKSKQKRRVRTVMLDVLTEFWRVAWPACGLWVFFIWCALR